MLLLAEARQFLTSTTEGLAFIDAARRSVRATVDDLALETVDSVTLTSDSGGIPVTVSNEGPHSLTFSVQLVSTRIREEPATRVELAPGESETLRLQASLRSTGRFQVARADGLAERAADRRGRPSSCVRRPTTASRC